MGQQPLDPIFAKTQHLTTLSQRLAWQIVQNVQLVSAPRDQPEPRCPQPARERPHILDAKFDLYFSL